MRHAKATWPLLLINATSGPALDDYIYVVLSAYLRQEYSPQPENVGGFSFPFPYAHAKLALLS